MTQLGNRVFFDQDGELVFQTGEMQGDVQPRKEITSIGYVDLPYGSYEGYQVVAIDSETKEPILEPIPINETAERRRIRELEDALLLQAENDIGGIL